MVHLGAPVVEVEVEVPIEVQVERQRAGARGDPGLFEGKRRNRAEPSHLPQQEHEESGCDCDAAGESLTPASGDDIGEDGSASD